MAMMGLVAKAGKAKMDGKGGCGSKVKKYKNLGKKK